MSEQISKLTAENVEKARQLEIANSTKDELINEMAKVKDDKEVGAIKQLEVDLTKQREVAANTQRSFDTIEQTNRDLV